jgi:hypothetical protein
LSLWTPSGEHRVERTSSDAPTTPPTAGEPAAPGGPGPEAAGPSLEDLTPEQRAQVEEMAQQMEVARARMLQTPAGVVVGQQAAQFLDLAGIYLSEEPPLLDEARLAIDALAAVVEGLGSRLGEIEQPLRQALHQVKMAFVQTSGAGGATDSPGAG